MPSAVAADPRSLRARLFAWRRPAMFALKIVGTTILCGMLYRAVAWREAVVVAASIDLSLLICGLLLFVPQTLVSAWRWQRLLRPLAYVAYSESLRQTLAASALNLVVPAKLGDFSKAAMVPNEPTLRKQATIRALLEKLGDVGMLLTAIGIGFLGLSFGQGACLAIGCGCLLAVVNRFQARSFDYAAWIGATALLWIMHLAQIHFFVVACGVDVSLATTLQRAPIALFAGLAPAAFCGIGTRDAALVWLFADVATAPTMAIVGMLTALRYLVPGAVGIPMLLTLRRAKQPATARETAPEQPASRVASRRPTARARETLEVR
ncbi:MAG: flippase-like domain-containing protein [Planctomycetia bacterium]|nr:flippase-like domain-containing protein [Planctomycetia bacterium]